MSRYENDPDQLDSRGLRRASTEGYAEFWDRAGFFFLQLSFLRLVTFVFLTLIVLVTPFRSTAVVFACPRS